MMKFNLNQEARIIELGSPDKRYKTGRGPSRVETLGPLTPKYAERQVEELNAYYARVGRVFEVETRYVTQWVNEGTGEVSSAYGGREPQDRLG
jgi:hypothetical protein